MTKFIIHVPDNITDLDAVYKTASVIASGKISDNGNSYCYATTFIDDTVVFTKGTQSNGTTTFYISNKESK